MDAIIFTTWSCPRSVNQIRFFLRHLIMPSYMPIIASNRGKAPLGKFFPGIATLGIIHDPIHLKQNFPLNKNSSFRYLSEGSSKIPCQKIRGDFSIPQRNVSFFWECFIGWLSCLETLGLVFGCWNCQFLSHDVPSLKLAAERCFFLSGPFLPRKGKFESEPTHWFPRCF